MKKWLFLIALLIFGSIQVLADTYTVKPEQSSVGWLATKVGGQHNGGIGIESGFLEFDGDTWTGAEAVIDMTTITVEDIKRPSTNQKLVKHLESEDFFDVKNHQKASVKITNIKDLGDASYEVEAELVIKDIPQTVTFPVTMNQVGNTITAQAMLDIDRTLYDVKYGSGKFFEDLGDRMIDDYFSLVINVLAEKK